VTPLPDAPCPRQQSLTGRGRRRIRPPRVRTHPAPPHIQDVDTLLELIAAAEDAYQQLIAQHVDYAERALTTHIARPHNGAA